MLLNDITIKVSTTPWQSVLTEDEINSLSDAVQEILEAQAAQAAFFLEEMGLTVTWE